jgi:uroporphyrinogen decarboxylase
MPPAWHDSLLMKAARREPTERIPIWLMRQAGRYLPEYRALRRQTDFLTLCKNPRRCAEVAIRTVERLGVDAAILFSDLLLILEPMGLGMEFAGSGGPRLRNPIRSAREVDRLRELEGLEGLEFVAEAVQQTRAGLPETLPLIGFAGAPFTLAAYVIEGGASRDYHFAKTLMYSDPGAWDAMLGRLARSVARYLTAQVDAGAQLVQVFDSWAGCLGPDDYRRYVLPHSRALFEALAALRPGVPTIHFATGNPALLPLLSEAGGTIISVDWRSGLDDAWRAAGDSKGLQGNLDPAVLLASPTEIRRRVRQMIEPVRGRPGYIANLGHGVLPQTPVDNVLAMVAAVHEFG